MFAKRLALSRPQIKEQIKHVGSMSKMLLISSNRFLGMGAEILVIAFAFVMYAIAAINMRSSYHVFLKPV